MQRRQLTIVRFLIIFLLLHGLFIVEVFAAGSAIDMVLLKVMAERWLGEGCAADDWCDGADISHSGRVDLIDYAMLTDQRGPFASKPNPPDGSSYAPVNVVLEWRSGRDAQSHDVYFGTEFDDVNDASSLVTLGVYKGNYLITEYDPNGLEPDTVYYWRIDEVDSSTTYKGEVWSFRRGLNNDLTFFFVSDTHYSPAFEVNNKEVIDKMNAAPGTVQYPASLGGGFVEVPYGVLVSGDLTNTGSSVDFYGDEIYDGFTGDYGVNGQGRVNYPVYEGWGNHDGMTADYRLVKDGIEARTLQRPWVTNISDNGLHYSWDWDDVHFVNLNMYPGTSPGPLGDPEESLTFLAQDLSENVGSSGRPVLLYHHFGFDLYSSMWWWESEREAYYQVIKDYNIIMILHGHSHVTLHYMWNGIDVYSTATAPSGVFNVIHITGSQMTIAERTGDNWGFTWQKDLSW